MKPQTKLTDEEVKWHCTRVQKLTSGRANFDTMWQEIAERAYPEHANFITTTSPGEKRMQHVYDSVGIHSNQLLSSGLFSMLTSPASPWHQIVPADSALLDFNEVVVHLQQISRIMYHEIHRAAAGFSTAAHECYLSFGAFGNLCMYADENLPADSLSFNSIPLYECLFVENQYGIVDTLYRKYTRTVEFLIRKFGKENLGTQARKLADDNELDKLVECFHVIMPRETINILSPKSIDMPYASLYIDKQDNHVMHEGGFRELPFFGARFYKESFEVYGRGPGSTALPDLKMLMRVAQVTIRAAQKTVDPPLLMPDSGFLRPLRTTPGGLNFYRKGRINLKTDLDLLPSGNPGFGLDYSASLHQRIREAFYVDQLQLHEGPQMTATEVMQRTEEKLRLMGPLMGRIQTELLGPMLKRVFGLLLRAGKFPPMPEMLRGQPIKIAYTSPIAKAQEQVEANGLMRAFQVLDPLIKMDQEIIDIFNTDEMGRGVFDMFNVSRKFLNDTDEVLAIRKGRADAAKAKADAENLRAQGQGADSMARAGATMQEAGVDLEGMGAGDFGAIQ